MLALAGEYPEYQKYASQVKIIDTTADNYYGKGYQDVKNRVPYIKNTQKELSWEPKISMDDSLRKIFDGYRNQVEEARSLADVGV